MFGSIQNPITAEGKWQPKGDELYLHSHLDEPLALPDAQPVDRELLELAGWATEARRTGLSEEEIGREVGTRMTSRVVERPVASSDMLLVGENRTFTIGK